MEPQDVAIRVPYDRAKTRATPQLALRLDPPRGLVMHLDEAAPYVIPPGTPPVRISVGISGAGIKTSASTEITLLPSSVPGTEDCLGPGQSFSTTAGAIVPGSTFADELPVAIQTVAPEYSRSALVRGIEETIPVMALVCRTGHVLDAYSLPSYVNVGDLQPIQHDPKLVDAAIAAIRQYVFKPALSSGQAIAVWVMVPVRFRL